RLPAKRAHLSRAMDELSDDDRRSNWCADLVALTQFEPALLDLFGRPPGEWVTVRSLYQCCGVVDEGIGPALMATWLGPPPEPDRVLVLVLFFAAEALWWLTAYYNRCWLFKPR